MNAGTLLALLFLPLVGVASASTCLPGAAPSALPDADGALAPAAEGLALQAPGFLPVAHDESLAFDRVILRQQYDECLAAALAQGQQQTLAAAPASANGYVPKTPYDNTPHRFDMEQGGKRMTAADFDAWMQARGYRVSKGPQAAAPAAETVAD
jgi:hypothetical protein